MRLKATKPPCAWHATALQQRALRQCPTRTIAPSLPARLPPTPPDKSPRALPCLPRGPPRQGCRAHAACAKGPGGVWGCGRTHRCRRAVMLGPAARCCRRSARQYRRRSLAGRFYPLAYANDGDVTPLTILPLSAFLFFLYLFFFPRLLLSPPFTAQPSSSSPRTRVHAHKATHIHGHTRRHKHGFQLGS